MSSDVKETCKIYMISTNLAFESLTREECGIDLAGIPNNDQTREFLETAGGTGLPTILSQDDVVKKILVNSPADQQAAIQKQAQAFWNTARALIGHLQNPGWDPGEGCRK